MAASSCDDVLAISLFTVFLGVAFSTGIKAILSGCFHFFPRQKLRAIFHFSRFVGASEAISTRTKADRKRSVQTPIAKVETCSLRPRGQNDCNDLKHCGFIDSPRAKGTQNQTGQIKFETS